MDILENSWVLQREKLKVLTGEDVPGNEVARFENFTANLIAAFSTTAF